MGRAYVLGVNIFKSAVQGRFGGAGGARRSVKDIRIDIAAVQYAKEVDEGDSKGTLGSENQFTGVGYKRPREGEETDISVLSRDVLLTSKVCRRFHNCLAIVGSSPGCLHLDSGKP